MNPTPIRVGLAVLALVACGEKKPETPKISQVFPSLPLPPQATVVGRSGGPDALQLTLMSSTKVKEVESYYRAILTRNGWRLANDMRDRDGSLVLLAEQDGPPLWVRIKSTDDSVATIVELNGAVVAGGNQPEKPAS
jgi:hypothetical protein